MMSRAFCAFLVVLLLVAAAALVGAGDNPKVAPEILAEAERVGMRVQLEHFDKQWSHGEKMSESARDTLIRDAAEFRGRAAKLYVELATAKPKDKEGKQAYAARLVELSGLFMGRKNLAVYVEYRPELIINGEKCDGAFNWRERKIYITDNGLKGKLDLRLLTSTHEVIHSLNYEKHMRLLPLYASRADWQRHIFKYVSRTNTGIGRGADEVRTESGARRIVGNALGGLSEEARNNSEENVGSSFAFALKHGHEILKPIRSDGSKFFMLRLGQSRDTHKLRWGDWKENFRRVIGGEPVFGGIILGNKWASAPKCIGLEIVPKGNNWQLVIEIEAGGKTQKAVYDEFTLDDLWSAYHIVRPSEWMKHEYKVWNQECSLVHCEDETSGLRAGLHPALASSPMGVRCLAVEVASGEVLLRDPGKKFGKELKLALQWYDAPANISADNGRLRVVDAADPEGLLLRLRLVGTSDKFLENQAELPKDLGDEQKVLAAIADIVEARKRDGRGWITAEQVERELSKLTLRSALKSHKNLKVDQKAAVEAVMAAAPDLLFLDRFARTLAVLNWAADQLGDKFPAWPEDALVANFPVEMRVSENRVAELCRLPLTPVESMDIPDRQRAKGKEVWYAVMNQGRHVGWAQGFVGPVTFGDGEVQTKRWLKTVVYARRLNAEVVLVRENTVNTDKAGLLLGAKTIIGTAAGPRFEIQASGGGEFLSGAIFIDGKPTTPFRPEGGWAKDAVIYDSTYLSLSGRGFTLAKGQSETMKSIKLEDVTNNPSMPLLTVTRLDDVALTFRYKSVAGESTITWDADGFPNSIRPFGFDLEFFPTTQEASQDSTSIRPLMVSALSLTPVAPPLPSVHGTVRWKVYTKAGAAKFPTDDDPEWKVVERPNDLSVVIENALPLVHERTGFRRLATEDRALVMKWLASGRIADSGNPEVKAFARRACENAKATTPMAKFVALQRAVTAHIVGNYGEAGMAKASTIFATPSGDCKHHSILLTALLRAEGIPARMVYGLVVNANDPTAYAHAWVEGYADGHWHRLDSALYGSVFETVYLRQGALDETGDMEDFIKAMTKPAVERIETLSFVPSMKAVTPSAKAALTEEQQALVGRLGFFVGLTKLDTALKSMSPDGEPPAYEWKRVRELATKLGVEVHEVFPTSEAQVLVDRMNIVLVPAEQSTGSERQSWEARFGARAAASYALMADSLACVKIREFKELEKLLPEARKQLEADMNSAQIPAKIQKEIIRLLFEEKLGNVNARQVFGLLIDHFKVKEFANDSSRETKELLEALAK